MTLPSTPSFRLDGRRALVTGAGRGIGRAAAAALAQAGAEVVAVSRTPVDLFELVGQIRGAGGQAEAMVLDVAKVDVARAVIEAAGPFEVLVNGSGTNGTHGASEWDRRGGRPGKTERMLAVLDLSPDATRVEIKARYKQLVKLHHPDLHGGDKKAEERLKLINEAYTYLRDSDLFA